MAYAMQESNPAVSVLKMEHIVFDEISFLRMGFQQENNELEMSFSVTVSEGESKKYRVTLQATATKQNEFVAKVKVSGFVSVDEASPYGETLLKKNAVAILMPYVRSELTLITAQPETDPVVLPAFNINGLVDNMKKNQDETD